MKKKFEKSEPMSKELKSLRGNDPAPTDSETDKKSRRITIIVIAAVAAIAIIVGIIVSVYMSFNYMFEGNPVAVIDISIDDETYTLKYELYEDECPKGVANFCYLASIDYFDGTVVYDTQNKRVRFGGYTKTVDENGNATYSHHAYDEEFTTAHADDFNLVAYPDRVSESDHSKLFRYALQEDQTARKETDKLFTLNAYKHDCQIAATNFQIFGDPTLVPSGNGNNSIPGDLDPVPAPDDKITGTGGDRSRTFVSYPIGEPLNDDRETKNAINVILGLTTADDPVNDFFRPPVQTVTIDDVKIYNYGEYEKWTKSEYEHGFESYMTSKFGTNVFYSWTRYTYAYYK